MYRAGGKRKSAKAKEFTRGRELAEYRNLGRRRERLQAAHRRATVDAGRQGSVSQQFFDLRSAVEGASEFLVSRQIIRDRDGL